MENNLSMTLGAYLPILQKRIMDYSTYHGIKTLKNPFDFWLYMEIIWKMKPDFIIEIGNNWGGSTLALAHQLDLIGKGKIIGIDIDHSKIDNKVKDHPRIFLNESPALDAYTAAEKMIGSSKRTLVIEDSSHTYEHTLEVIKLYSSLTQINDYFIVEDTICHHGLNIGPNPGPYEAVQEFAKDNPNFIIDRTIETFVISHNPSGFLKRVK